MKLFDYLSEQEQIAIVKRNGCALYYITNPSLAVQLEAVNENGLAVDFIDNPSNEVKIAAVKQDPRALRFIKVLICTSF